METIVDLSIVWKNIDNHSKFDNVTTQLDKAFHKYLMANMQKIPITLNFNSKMVNMYVGDVDTVGFWLNCMTLSTVYFLEQARKCKSSNIQVVQRILHYMTSKLVSSSTMKKKNLGYAANLHHLSSITKGQHFHQKNQM